MDSEMKLPLGFRFHPTDEELILHYLRRKLFSIPLPAPAVSDFNTHPSLLPGDLKEKRYFFTERKWNTTTTIISCNHFGYWKNIRKEEIILLPGTNKPIGKKKTFIFYETHQKRLNGSWNYFPSSFFHPSQIHFSPPSPELILLHVLGFRFSIGAPRELGFYLLTPPMDFDLDPLDDLLPDGAVKNTRAGGKFQPKAKPRPPKPSSSVSVPSSQHSTATVTSATQPSQNNEVCGSNNDNNISQNADVYIGFDSFDDFCPQSTTLEVNALGRSPTEAQVITETETEAKTLDDPLTRGEATISANCQEFQVESRQFETQESNAFSCLDTQDIMAEPTTDSGHRRGKLQPVPKPQAHAVKRNGENPNVRDATDSLYLEDDNIQRNSSQTEYIDGEVQGTDPEYAAPVTDDIDFSATITGFYEESMPTDPTSLDQINQEQEHTNTEEVHQQDAIPEVPEVGTVRSSKRQRKRINEYQLVDESDDEEVRNDVDPTYDYSLNEDNNVDGEYLAENEEAPKKKAGKKLKKDTADKEKKPVRKRKKANEESDKSTEAPPKKFPHSTRRNKRRTVDKTLLETPEDEIDFKKLKIRDLIIYAEYKERAEKKDAITSQTPTANQSDATSSANRYNEEEGFGWEPQERDYDEEGEEKPVEETITYFNYQTHMEKTPVTKWSKQDTELFYEGIQQFGTDLSMIQQLFPDRTRRQIKLKYKKEERQQPLRLHEAIVNRSSDHSHFESVIERLKKIAAEEKMNSDMDDGSDGLIGVEADEVALEANGQEELAKTEKVEEREEVEHVQAADIQSPVKSCDDDSEDDMFRWNQYNSEL